MAILKLSPACKAYLWGGTTLVRRYGKTPPRLPLAESWELSCHPDGPALVAAGPGRGHTLPDYLAAKGAGVLGHNCEGLPEFPILIKLIDAKKPLSVQVHPNNDYAYAHEGQPGKTEMWVILESAPNAFLYLGFRQPVSEGEVRAAVENGTLPTLLHRVPVCPGDAFVIPAGTVHAIGAGIVLAEVQQSSNLTYRLYDYGRQDADGKPRPLHLEKALQVLCYGAGPAPPPAHGHLAATDYFVVDRVAIAGGVDGMADEDSFTALLVTEGQGLVYSARQAFTFGPGASFFIEAGTGPYSVIGNCTYLAVRIPAGLKKRLGHALQRTATP